MAVDASVSVAIRVDSGTAMGSGHVIRCLTLADELVRGGGNVTFICRELAGNLSKLIERHGHLMARLSAPDYRGPQQAGDGSRWLGVPWRQDSEETAAVLQRLRARWLIVDHYGIGADWERLQRTWIDRLMVIDDLADRVHDCDVLLDQNYFGRDTQIRYAALVPPQCRLLLGPRYALLQREYSDLCAAWSGDRREPRRVFVFFGGSDATDETSKTLRALQAPKLAALAVDVVVGENHPAPDVVAELVARRPGTTLYRNLPTLAGLMFRADIAVGAGGTTMLERQCLRLPSVVITVAANQEQPSAGLAAEGAIILAGRAPHVGVADITTAIIRALNTRGVLPSLVDGHGLARVNAAILPPLPSKLALRHARIGDAKLLFDWRNEVTTRAMSFDGNAISLDSHLQWFAGKLADPESLVLIGQVAGLPVGQVRLDFQNDEAVLSYGVDADLRGLGFGAALVELAVRFVRRRIPKGFRARVKKENVASRKNFQRLGWHETISGAEYVFRLSDADLKEMQSAGHLVGARRPEQRGE